MIRPRGVRRILGVLLAAVSLGSCRAESPDLYELEIGSARLLVEVADTPESRQRGLMERDSLPEGRGMLFVFEESAPRSFWMKNTLIPLSIAYIDGTGVIREMHNMQPLSLESVPSRFPARYALEVNQGEFERLGVAVGRRLLFSARLERRITR